MSPKGGKASEADFTCTFRPGQIGLTANWTDGVVDFIVKGGQAERIGVQVGMRFAKVGLANYTEDILDEAIAGTLDYQVTFVKAENQSVTAGKIGSVGQGEKGGKGGKTCKIFASQLDPSACKWCKKGECWTHKGKGKGPESTVVKTEDDGSTGKGKTVGEKRVHSLMQRSHVDCPWCKIGQCWDHKVVITSDALVESAKKRQRLETPLWEELAEAHKDAMGEALHKTLLKANIGENIDHRDSYGGWNFSAMNSCLQHFLTESTDDVQLLPSRKIHVGMMDYMGESHETYRKALDFIETSNTWYDTDNPNRRCVRWLPEECGWQDPSIYDDLASRVDDGFSLVVKVSHVATHMCRLERPDSWWPQLWQQKYSRVAKGAFAFLWQFAPKFQFSPESRALLEELFLYLAQRPEGAKLRHIVDFRNASWYNEDIYELLKAHGVCLAWLHLENTGWAADLPNGWTPTVQTADFTFLRLFGNEDRCTGSYDREFLLNLYQMCPQNAHSYVLFGNKATKDDPEPLVPACFQNAKDFRSIFSTVDFLAPLVSIKNKGRCPRILSNEDSKRVTRFFIRYSETARSTGIRVGMTVHLVEVCEERCFEWSWEANDAEAVRLRMCDVGEEQDLMRFAKQITGMEDVDIVEELCLMGPRELSLAETQLVNSTFIRFSHAAREAGILRTTPAKVAFCAEEPRERAGAVGTVEELVVQWTRTETAMTGVAYSNMNTLSHGPFAALSVGDLRAAMAEETEILTLLCDMLSSLAEDAQHMNSESLVKSEAVKHETESDGTALDAKSGTTDTCKASDSNRDASKLLPTEREFFADVLRHVPATKALSIVKEEESHKDLAQRVSAAKMLTVVKKEVVPQGLRPSRLLAPAVGVKEETVSKFNGTPHRTPRDTLRMQSRASHPSHVKVKAETIDKGIDSASGPGAFVQTQSALQGQSQNQLKNKERKPLGRLLRQQQKLRRFRKRMQKVPPHRLGSKCDVQATGPNTFATGDTTTARLQFDSIIASCRAAMANFSPPVKP